MSDLGEFRAFEMFRGLGLTEGEAWVATKINAADEALVQAWPGGMKETRQKLKDAQDNILALSMKLKADRFKKSAKRTERFMETASGGDGEGREPESPQGREVLTPPPNTGE